MTYTIQQLPAAERPRERMAALGSEALATSELVAILLGSGMQGKSVLELAKELVTTFGSLRNLAEATTAELSRIKGVGPAKATLLKAAFTLASRLAQEAVPPRTPVKHPLHAYQLVKESLEQAKKELFMTLLLDTRGCVFHQELISVGTLNRTLVHPREVFHPAVRHQAASLIVAHNHPSGDPTPSQADLTLTERLIETGAILGIPLNDHLIIGRDSYRSLRQDGRVPF